MSESATTKPVIGIIIGSTRPGRAGKPIGDWLAQATAQHGAFDVRVLDLAEINLPFFDEPKHPRLGQYTHQHTKDWAAQVAACDAFLVVTNEYNHSFSAPLKNALDFLSSEWANKSVGIVSYGGVSAGLRAASHLKETLVALQMWVTTQHIAIPFGPALISDGVFTPAEETVAALAPMLDTMAARHPLLAELRAA
ncbi:NAD(P)H-dependent oxidoreductase [Tessaracoccus sp. SD287]|uniref:NADPH-dependent FMN reductase n=1 Tax=Tessaracoccus sp. SD287 TaxID=2782008 RepID=UPI001A97CBF5|nr:NAD(P)H-dependent oxidoreductase [Tessaracoccus sp. SD287]MBO1030544.1 NAD(P)H-dependent oxidoreductase [Tessaracoccus sp. SD287]